MPLAFEMVTTTITAVHEESGQGAQLALHAITWWRPMCCESRTSCAFVQVVLSFFERRQRAASGWWGPKEERLVWEAWYELANYCLDCA